MITDKQTLIAAVESYMHRDDASTGGQMDTWLQIAEARINERVRALQTEVLAELVADGDTQFDLPEDFMEARVFFNLGGDEIKPVGWLELRQFTQLNAGMVGAPSAYVITGSYIYVAPTPAAGTELRLLYHAKPAALAADIDTNVLLTAHPDLYLYGVLREGYTWERNADMFANADGKFNDLVEKINAIDERRRFGPGISVGSNTSYGAFTGSNGGM